MPKTKKSKLSPKKKVVTKKIVLKEEKTISKRASKSIKADVKKVVAVDKKPYRQSKLTISVLGVDGKEIGKTELPGQYFNAKINNTLLAQAVRVYLANQRAGSASTKTRGEVVGSTRKIYKQKGTGRARHGAIRAPIFVGGGIAFGPEPRDYSLSLSKNMKKSALQMALTQAKELEKLIIVDGFSTLKPKTKVHFKVLNIIAGPVKILLAVSKKANMTTRSVRNIPNVTVMPAVDLYPYAILSCQKLIITRDALAEFIEHVSK